MSTLMTTPTPGMVSPPAPFSLDAIRRQVLHRVDMPGLHKDEDDDEEDNTMAAATQDVGMNGDCEEEDAEDEGAEEGCSVGDAEGDADGDDEAPRQPSADDEPRRNKRKNFKPRNILYDEDNPQAPGAPAPGHGGGASDSDGDEQQHGLQHGLPHGMDADLAAAGILDAHGVKRRSRKPLFAPQKRYAAEEGGSPVPRFGALDLSAQGLQGGQQPENEDDSSAFGEDDDSRSSYPTLNHLNSGPEDESSDVNLSDGGGGGGVAPSVSMLSRNHLLKPRVQVRTHMERDRDSSSAADGDSSLDLSSSDGRLFGRQQVFGAPDASPRGPGSSSPSAEDALAADLSRARDLDGMLGAASPLGTMAAHMAAAAAFRRQGGAMGPEQNAMKEFAEKTMRELLGIYGIGAADFGEPLSGLPMANFASGKMLEALGGGALNLGLARAAAVMLPQNLHTILTLAALQDQGIAAKAIRTPSMPMLDAKSEIPNSLNF
ncbi:uncharacterized protein LOC117643952 [Thrips palmi]|uniref:Uncharacterized protein LOC117643952 n=1 Tax=Thrips palmi TaxID=161013 RepID=A0A6P8YP68_THRPL|nr:uncharacterized protein LOC117643952 [Thrips palmi]